MNRIFYFCREKRTKCAHHVFAVESNTYDLTVFCLGYAFVLNETATDSCVTRKLESLCKQSSMWTTHSPLGVPLSLCFPYINANFKHRYRPEYFLRYEFRSRKRKSIQSSSTRGLVLDDYREGKPNERKLRDITREASSSASSIKYCVNMRLTFRSIILSPVTIYLSTRSVR